MLKMACALITILAAGVIYAEAAQPGFICASFSEPRFEDQGGILSAGEIRVSFLNR